MYKRNILFSLTKAAKSCLFVIIAIMPFIGFSQQEPQFTQYMFNRLSYNPAYAGSNGAMCLTGFYRNQWMGLKLTDINNGNPSTPTTLNFSFDLPIRILHGGLGATIVSDKIGYWDQTFVKLDYAYRFELPTGNLAIGIETQFFSSAIDFGKLVGSDQINELDQIIPSNDPVLRDASQQNDFLFDLGLGVYYQIPGKFYAGLSSTKLLETKSEKLKWQDKRHYFILAGYEWTIPAYPSFRVLPSAILKTELSTFQLDASALLEYNYMFWGGVNFRIQDAVSVLGGLTLGGFKLGMAYDIPTGRVSGKSFGSFELFVRYCFKVENQPKPPTSYRNTRMN
ncbi:MAG: type IX secretion system membrane protein PorP/SprF [Bacteroidales bacterium]|nr:type IX secretion system membrane protein PorP/SprF [Bacteroidales bacterium]MDD4684681.1 type IX secretion system membrane protein PorP/SprF [Bacteroidales bacterium]